MLIAAGVAAGFFRMAEPAYTWPNLRTLSS